MRFTGFAALLLLSSGVLAAACGSDSTSGSNGSTPGVDGGMTGTNDAAAADASTVNPTPTISAWLGTNVAADLWAADLARQLDAFSGTTDANGLPSPGTSGTSSTDAGFLLPTGAHTLPSKSRAIRASTGCPSS